MFKKILALTLSVLMLATLCVSFASCGEKEASFEAVAKEDLKIGFIFLHDENSTYDKNFIDAANRMKTELGLTNDQVILETNIEEGAGCYNKAKELAEKGCNIVFADSFGHEQYLIQAAQEYPNVRFCHATGTMAHTADLDNFSNAFASIYEGRFLAGVAAGMKLNQMIEEGKITAEQAVIGYVGAFKYAEVISGMTSFFLGARYICPSATMKVQFTGTWYDLALENAAANTLIDAGCVLISQHADSMGAPTACQLRNIPNISYNGSTKAVGPTTFIVSSAIDWTPYFKYIVECAISGDKIDTDWTGTIETGSVILSEINDAAAAPGTAAKIAEVKADMTKSKNPLRVFDIDTFKVNGEKLSSYKADVDTDANYTPDTQVIKGGYFHESEYRSAPYFDIKIDGITWLN